MAIKVVQGFKSNKYLMIKLPNSWLLKLLVRSLLLVLLIVSLPWIGSIFGDRNNNVGIIDPHEEVDSDSIITSDFLSFLFRDLKNEGILRLGDQALFLTDVNEEYFIYNSHNLNENDMDIVYSKDLKRQDVIPNESFDFVFTYNFHATSEFIDRTLKLGGIVAVQMRDTDPSSALINKPSNYQTVYFRRFDNSNVIMAIKKTNNADHETNFDQTQSPQLQQWRVLSKISSSEAKRAALNKLEDVLLEPPRSASRRSSRYLKRTRFLPDLMGDSLKSYPRRVFVDVGLPDNINRKAGRASGTGTDWFLKHYPARNLDFEMYRIEILSEECAGKEVAEVGMSDWVRKNVKEEEYMVMKAEAEIVEEMVKSKTIRLVDELFLECRPRGKGNGSRRAYWECLSLYGRLRDEGVAVHQWWG